MSVPSIHSTTCVLDCPDACRLEVTVQDGRVVRIGGGRDHPDTAGFICSKVSRFGRRVHHAERILHPLQRVGRKGEGRFERLSWEEAVTEVAGRLTEIRERWGGEAILPYRYGGSNGYLTNGLLDDLFFARLGASRLARTLCAAPTGAVALGMYGKMPGVAFEDYVEARCIVLWGANPRVSNIHLVPYLREARRRGAFLAVVDPRRTLPAAEVDLHLAVLPGTDLPVALAMIRWWRQRDRLAAEFLGRRTEGGAPLLAAAEEWPLERAAQVAGVAAAEIERLAAVYADASPAVVRCGWGLERNRNGGRAVAAVLAMPALLGKFGLRGGGYTLSNSGAYRFRADRLIGTLDWRTRILNMTRLGRLLTEPLDPPVKALFVYNANPVATVPEQNRILAGLAREDLFTVVSEQVMTDTARFADVVLPATTFLEGHDLRGGYGSYILGPAPPVIPAVGEARSNQALFAALGRALGFTDEAFGWSDEELFTRAAAAVEAEPEEPRVAERLRRGEAVPRRFAGGTPRQLGNVEPPTPGGRIHLAPGILGPAPYRFEPAVEGPPLALVSPATSRLVSSTLGEFNLERLRVALHPDEARLRGLAAGQAVRVFNDLGEVVCQLEVTDAVRRGVASMPKGAWRKASGNGSTSTALCPDHVGVAGGACFNDARVEVEAVS